MEDTLPTCERVIVLDNGLRQVGHHSFAIARGLVQALQDSAGIPCAIYALRDIEAGLDRKLPLVPHFEYSLYAHMPASKLTMRGRRLKAALTGTTPDGSPSERRTSRNLNASFRADLEALPAEVWSRGTVVLFPGLFQHQLLGLAEFLQVHARHIDAKIVCQLMFETSWLPWPQRSRLGTKTYRKVFKILRPLVGRVITFTSENTFVSEHYRQAFGIPIEVLPVPLTGADSNPEPCNKIRLGYFGYSKVEKGFDLLPAAIAQCQGLRDDLSFAVQVQHHGGDPNINAAETALRNMAKVRILEGALQEEVFAAETASVDVVLLPYHPDLFGMRGSGLFIESVTAGRLIVASRRTWAGRSIEFGEAIGETFEPHSSDALADAVLRLCAAISEKKPLARKKAQAFAATYSIPSYLQKMFAAAGMRDPLKAGVAAHRS